MEKEDGNGGEEAVIYVIRNESWHLHLHEFRLLHFIGHIDGLSSVSTSS